MKRTAGGIVSARFFKRDTFINHIDDINAVEEFLYEAFWNQNMLLCNSIFVVTNLYRNIALRNKICCLHT